MTEEQFMKRFGFCGCYDPEQAIRHVATALRLIDTLEREVWTDRMTRDKWNAMVEDQLGNSACFTYYWMDKEKLTEHGGGVPGWLTPAGKKLLRRLELLIAKYDAAENQD